MAALGIVYGDIGTSPLYALRESLIGLPINLADVLGVLSLIFWALIIIISIKYLSIIFRADNEGEGGILALLALLKGKKGKTLLPFFIVGIFGGGLMLGDGMITPAISVISAIEGLQLVSPSFTPLIVPLSCTILFFLFYFQSAGTEKIGYLFGPVIIVWFIVLAALGLHQIIQAPIVLKAMNPIYAIDFLYNNGWKGYGLLGGIFLVVTGGEALYADLGHFGKTSIRLSWYLIVLPGLVLNYFGQGAYLLDHPTATTNPFFQIAPSWFFIPLIIIATLATIIASQAVISATFSLTKQAVLLGLYPRLPIVQTSEKVQGQIYIPQINFIMAIGTLLLIITFKSSNALAHAYGIAVNLVMVMVTLMIIYVARRVWHWSITKVCSVFSLFVFIDVLFLGANVQKILTGGWMPILFAIVTAFIMYTWDKGMDYLRKNYYTKQSSINKIVRQLNYKSLNKIHDVTAIFITDIYDNSGGVFLHFLKLSNAIPENILILSYIVDNVPYVNVDDRFEFHCLNPNFCQLTLHYGFMDFIDIPKTLEVIDAKKILPFKINTSKATYLVEIPNITASKQKKTLLFYWQERLFAFLMRNYSANLNIEFYQLPYNKTIAIGTYFVI